MTNPSIALRDNVSQRSLRRAQRKEVGTGRVFSILYPHSFSVAEEVSVGLQDDWKQDSNSRASLQWVSELREINHWTTRIGTTIASVQSVIQQIRRKVCKSHTKWPSETFFFKFCEKISCFELPFFRTLCGLHRVVRFQREHGWLQRIKDGNAIALRLQIVFCQSRQVKCFLFISPSVLSLFNKWQYNTVF